MKSKKSKSYEQETSVSLNRLEVEAGFNVSKNKSVDDLVPSFKEYGMDNPIHVRRKKGSEKLLIVDGHRRFLAAEKAGLKVIKVVDHGFLSNADAWTLAHRQNWQRRKVSKGESMETCTRLQKEGLGVVEIANRLMLAKSTVSEYLTLSRASPKLRAAAKKSTEEGGIPKKVALKAARLTKKQQEKATAKLEGKTAPEAEAALPPQARIAVTPTASDYRLVSDYKERCQRMEIEVKKRLKDKAGDKKLQGMELVIGVLRGRLTVDQAFVNWEKV